MNKRLIAELAKALEWDAPDPQFCDLIAVAGDTRRQLSEAKRIIRMAALNSIDVQNVAQDYLDRVTRHDNLR